jgi:hypothetical protein
MVPRERVSFARLDSRSNDSRAPSRQTNSIISEPISPLDREPLTREAEVDQLRLNLP